MINATRQMSKIGYRPKIREGEEVASVITHEFGHTLKDPDFSADVDNLWKKYQDEFPKGIVGSDKKEFISGYASYSKGEFISEALVAAMHTDSPPSVAVDVMNLINKHFKRRENL